MFYFSLLCGQFEDACSLQRHALQYTAGMDSNDSLTPLSARRQLWLIAGGAEFCTATSGLLRTRAKTRTQTLEE